MAIDDFDSDEGIGNDRRSYMKNGSSSYGRSMNNGNSKASILKNSSSSYSTSKKASQFSDDDDDDMYNNGSRLSNRNANRNYNDSPLNSHRSDIGKPPSGRLQPISSLNDKLSTNRFDSKTNHIDYGLTSNKKSSFNNDYETKDSSYSALTRPTKNLPAITYPKSNNNESDDSFNEKYNSNNKFSKQKLNETYDKNDYSSSAKSKYEKVLNSFSKDTLSQQNESKYDSKYDSKFETKYDTYDEDDNGGKKFYRSESPLKSSKFNGTDLENRSPNNLRNSKLNELTSSKNGRSNSLDRITSAYNSLTNTSLGPGTGSKLQKYSSANNINDNASDKSYTINSFNSTTMSIREAKSRSYLVGSLSALNGKGLLSNEELDRHFIDRKARVLISTWNMGGIKKIPSNLDDLVLPDTIQTMPDVYVLGAQEFDLNPKDWEICLQEHIGPTHVKLSSYYHGSVGAVVFVKRELIWFCSVVEFEHINLRAVHAPGRTKASIVISFQLFGTLLCFLCSHFAAGEGQLEQRIENYKTTISNMKLPRKLLNKNRALSTDATDNFDCVFWFGDFNFLITKEREKVEKKVTNLRERRGLTSSITNSFEEIINHDELNMVITQEKGFKHFLEGRITFEPTYKYDVNSDNYDTSDKCRIPSYCDRILYRSRQKGSISCSYYDAIKEIKLSDHRPVFGLYEVTIRPGVDKVPLSYGDFDRQVYAAGYQKRQMYRAYDVGFETQNSKKSPCVIQ